MAGDSGGTRKRHSGIGPGRARKQRASARALPGKAEATAHAERFPRSPSGDSEGWPGGSAEDTGPADRVRGCRRMPLRGSVSFRERSCPGRRTETTREPAGRGGARNKSFPAADGKQPHRNKGFPEGKTSTARAMTSAGKPPSGARTLLGYTDSQSGRSPPLVGPPRGGTARSPSIWKFSRLCPGKQPREEAAIQTSRIKGTEQRATGSRAAAAMPMRWMTGGPTIPRRAVMGYGSGAGHIYSSGIITSQEYSHIYYSSNIVLLYVKDSSYELIIKTV